MNSRFRFLFCLAASLLALAGCTTTPKTVGTGSDFKGPLGLQLYSLRADFIQNVPKALDQVKALGFEYIELAGTYNLPAEQFKAMLDERNLKPVANLIALDRFRDDIEGVIKEAKTLGIQYVGAAWIPHKAPFDEKQAWDTITLFNAAGTALQKHGLKFYYHFHGFEFAPHGQGTLADLMVEKSDPKCVDFELDVFWAVHAGQDPAALLEKHGKRFVFMHVKDMKAGTPKNILTGQADVNNDVAIGTGIVEWPRLLKAAQKAGLKYYFIEDESPRVKEQIPQSIQFLESVKF